MKKYFRTLQSVLDSRWGNFQYAGTSAAQKTDRVLQSSKLEDCIYRDLSRDDENMENIQQEAASKLHSFPALSRDIFQSFYSIRCFQSEPTQTGLQQKHRSSTQSCSTM